MSAAGVPSTDDLLRAPELAGLGEARPGLESDAIDEVVPRLVITPDSAEHLAAVLQWAARTRLSVVVRGGGSKGGWGRVAPGIDLVVSMAALNRLVAHRHGDLTATIEAGARLADIGPQLARQGQWLPVDSAFDSATIGGIVATNDAGPLRHRFGTPRDLLIGATLALTDGRIVKSGGHVVKNVAGYDMGKLMSGSHGTLATIVDATFKLLPIPAASRTIAVQYGDAAALAGAIGAIASSQLEPMALDIRAGGAPGAHRYSQYVRFATSPAAVDAQAAAAHGLAGGEVSLLEGEEETGLWREQVRRPWASEGALVRMGWLPASLPAVLALIDEAQRESGAAFVELTARPAVGAGVLRVDASDDEQQAIVERLRARGGLVGHVAVLRARVELKRRVDVWGPPGAADSVLRSLKRAFDPAGILNAGRGPV